VNPILLAALEWLLDHQFDAQADDPHSYRVSYSALCDLFRRHVRVEVYETCLAGANAVYGWMPTILRTFPAEHERPAYAPKIGALAAASCWEEAAAALQAQPEVDVLRLCNNASVGASKFLHFLNPNVFPIWDSNIQAVLGAISYPAYGSMLHEAIEEQADGLAPGFPQAYEAFIGERVSPLRKWEYLLFLRGRAIRDAARAAE
jgi:hypothetical protein